MSFTNKKISQIRPMKTRDPEVDRVNIHIYDKLNEIIGIVNTPEKKIPKEETEGKKQKNNYKMLKITSQI